jgi:hypothetical protein
MVNALPEPIVALSHALTVNVYVAAVAGATAENETVKLVPGSTFKPEAPDFVMFILFPESATFVAAGRPV